MDVPGNPGAVFFTIITKIPRTLAGKYVPCRGFVICTRKDSAVFAQRVPDSGRSLDQTATHSSGWPDVSRRQGAFSLSTVQILGMLSGKNFDLPWDFPGPEKTLHADAIPG
jgi:hypothetical protein